MDQWPFYVGYIIHRKLNVEIYEILDDLMAKIFNYKTWYNCKTLVYSF